MVRKVLRSCAVLLCAVLIVGAALAVSPNESYAADYACPDPGDICIDYDNDPSGHFTSSKLYYSSSSKQYTSGSGGYEAWYNTSNGTLYLWNYSGGSIRVNNSKGKELKIYLIGDNTITTSCQFGIWAEGVRLIITSDPYGSSQYDPEDPPILTIDQEYDSNISEGAGLCNYFTGSDPEDIVICEGTKVEINSKVRRNGSGIRTYGKLTITDDADVDVNLMFAADGTSGQHSEAVFAANGVSISTSGRVNFSVAARDNWAGKFTGWAVYIENTSGSFDLQPGALYVSLSAVGSNIGLCNRAIPQKDLNTTGYYDTIEAGHSYVVRFFRSDYDGSEAIPLNGFFFPDPSFREILKNYYTSGRSGWASLSELQDETSMYVGDNDAYSIKGIEYFTQLEVLNWRNGHIRDIDLSNNSQLVSLYLSDNDLESIDTSHNLKLLELEVNRNKLTQIDVSKNTALQSLMCTGNAIKSLDLSKLNKLSFLYCGNNLLTSLDVQNNTLLQELSCGNDFVYEDGSDAPPAYENYNQIRTLDVSACPDLMDLFCYRNGMSSLRLGNNSTIGILYCYENDLGVLDISGCPILKDLRQNGKYDDQGQYYIRYYKNGYWYEMRVDSKEMMTEAPDKYALVTSAQLVLKDNIYLKINFDIPDSASDWTAYLYYEKDNETNPAFSLVRKSVALGTYAGTTCSLSFEGISAKELNDRVRVVIKDSNGHVASIAINAASGLSFQDHFDYCAADYARTAARLTDPKYAKLSALGKALLNFGGTAQEYFAYKLDNRSNASEQYLSYEMAQLSASDLAAHKAVNKSGDKDAAGYYGLALTLKDYTEVVIYCTKDSSVTKDNIVVSMSKSGSYWIGRIRGIAAKNLADRFIISVTYDGNTFKQDASALSWAYTALDSSATSTVTKDLAKALFLYYQAASAYFGN